MANSVEAFWKTVKEIKLDDIRTQALKPLKVALIGSEDELTWLQEHFRAGARDAGDLRRVSDTLKLFESPPDEEALKAINGCTFACISPEASVAMQGAQLTVTVPLYTIGNEGEWLHFKREILDTRWDLHLTLGRNLPGLRPDVLEYLIVNMACVNAEVAVVSAVFAKIPGIGPIYPGVAFGDTVILTKNQVMMAFRVAGAYGHSIDIVHRKTEVLSILLGGLGWRTVAREAAGLVPTPAAIALKGAIAYAGTYTVGKVIAHFFETGDRLARADERQLYKEALASGRAFAGRAMAKMIPKGLIPRRPARFRRRGNRAARTGDEG